MNRVLLTGATSFTGAHIARAFRDAGFEVIALLTRTADHYADGLAAKRLRHGGLTHCRFEAPFGSDPFFRAIAELRPTVFINHGAAIEGYRRPDFDFLESLRQSTHQARRAVAELKTNGCGLLVHTGSFFEPGEGFGPQATDRDTPAMSIYGASKRMTWDALRQFCREGELPLAKLVIPDPIGTLENADRLIPFAAQTWKRGEPMKLFTPSLVRDHIPAEWLAAAYVRLVRDSLVAPSEMRIARPSGFVVSNADFLNRFAQAFMAAGFTGACRIETTEGPTREPPVRANLEPVPELAEAGRSNEFWENYARHLLAE